MRDFSVLDDLVEGVQVISFDMRYVYLNRVLLQEVGMTREEVIGFCMSEKFPGIEDTEIFAEIYKCLETRANGKFINEFTFGDGRQAYYEISIQPIEEGAILFSRDITATKKGEILLKETNKQLEHFSHIVAHDLREPIRRIAIQCDELVRDYDEILPVNALDICANMQHQAELLMQMVKDYRTLAGIDQKAIKKEPIEIVGFAKETAAQLCARDSKVTFEWPEGTIVIDACKSMLSILFRNLIENASAFGQGMVRFHCTSSSSSEHVFCLCNETSEASPREDIFLPFVKSRPSNSGLGLTICKKLMDLHGGRIWSERQGDKFRMLFSFPVAS